MSWAFSWRFISLMGREVARISWRRFFHECGDATNVLHLILKQLLVLLLQCWDFLHQSFNVHRRCFRVIFPLDLCKLLRTPAMKEWMTEFVWAPLAESIYVQLADKWLKDWNGWSWLAGLCRRERIRYGLQKHPRTRSNQWRDDLNDRWLYWTSFGQNRRQLLCSLISSDQIGSEWDDDRVLRTNAMVPLLSCCSCSNFKNDAMGVTAGHVTCQIIRCETTQNKGLDVTINTQYRTSWWIFTFLTLVHNLDYYAHYLTLKSDIFLTNSHCKTVIEHRAVLLFKFPIILTYFDATLALALLIVIHCG